MTTWVERVPGVAPLARLFERISRWRVGAVPAGLLALLPVALFVDLFDAADELAGGPLGMGIAFLLQSAFLLALTRRSDLAFGLSASDLVPLLDTIPFSTIVLVRLIVRAWGAPPPEAPLRPEGPVIDV